MKISLALLIPSLAATAAFALSGLVEAARKRLDIVGVMVVCFLASFGGGTLRDLLLEGRPGAHPKVLVIIDECVARSQPRLIETIEAYFASGSRGAQLVCPPVVIEGGERTKNSYFHVSEIQSHVDRYHIDRHSYIVAIGGGALLDMVGLAASTAHRGVRHIRIPTTTLAQDDSGVGVKNGINAFGKKNFIGTFSPPFAVINDFQLLATLSARDKRAGYVEAVKVACIRDAEFFANIERDATALAEFEPAAMQRLIYRCAELHLNHIATSGDAFEFGSARPLDFGHWAAHKLEQLSEYKLRHGEAVGYGMLVAAQLATARGALAARDQTALAEAVSGLGPLPPIADVSTAQMLEAMKLDKKVVAGRLHFVLPTAIGGYAIVDDVTTAEIAEALRAIGFARSGAPN